MDLCIWLQSWMFFAGLLLAAIVATKNAAPLGVDAAAAQAASQSPNKSSEAEAIQSLEIYGTLAAAVDAFGLADCWQWKPLIDGKQVGLLIVSKCLIGALLDNFGTAVDVKAVQLATTTCYCHQE